MEIKLIKKITKVVGKGKSFARVLLKRFIFSNPATAYLARRFIFGRQLFKKQVSYAEQAFFLGLDFRGKVVFDIGSSIGHFTQFFAASVGKRGCVVAFEPNPAVYDMLINRIGTTIGHNVLAVNMAIGQYEGNCKMSVRNNETATGSIDPDIKNQIIAENDFIELEVSICSLDSYVLSKQKVDRIPDFIKIDVEGAEFDVLKGALSILKTYHPKLFIEIHGATMELKEKNIEEIVIFLKGQGYLIHHLESGQDISFENHKLAREGHIYCS